MKNENKDMTGKKAKVFCLPNQNNEKICLKDILEDGKKVILFFYPKDMTSGCTTEAAAFSEAKRKFTARGIKVFGVSKLGVESKQKFVEKNNLKIDLLADEDLKVAEKYGVLQEKENRGKVTQTISRETFIIDTDRKILKHFTSVKPANHLDEIMEFLKNNK